MFSHFPQPVEIPTAVFMTFNSKVWPRASYNAFTLPSRSSCRLLPSLMPLPVVLSFLRRSCHLASQSFIPSMPSIFARLLFPNFHAFWVCGRTLSLPCPWQQCPLSCAGISRWVNRPRVAANFVQDPPLPWVRFLADRGALRLNSGSYIVPSVLQKFPPPPFP
jgi:hypothetical protein